MPNPQLRGRIAVMPIAALEPPWLGVLELRADFLGLKDVNNKQLNGRAAVLVALHSVR